MYINVNLGSFEIKIHTLFIVTNVHIKTAFILSVICSYCRLIIIEIYASFIVHDCMEMEH